MGQLGGLKMEKVLQRLAEIGQSPVAVHALFVDLTTINESYLHAPYTPRINSYTDLCHLSVDCYMLGT